MICLLIDLEFLCPGFGTGIKMIKKKKVEMVGSVSMVCSKQQKDLKAFEQKAIRLFDASAIASFDED